MNSPDAPEFSVTGFVLAGGESSRMGADKAMLPFEGGTLAAHVARVVRDACGSATIVGPPEKYGQLGYPVIPDLRAGLGPLSGIEAALQAAQTEWVLVTACDMPGLTTEFLRQLIREGAVLEGENRKVDAVLPIAPGGPPEPLCALYNKRALAIFRDALDKGILKVTRALEPAHLCLLPIDDAQPLENMNTPEEWRNRRLG